MTPDNFPSDYEAPVRYEMLDLPPWEADHFYAHGDCVYIDDVPMMCVDPHITGQCCPELSMLRSSTVWTWQPI
jgi:hypothetical protein